MLRKSCEIEYFPIYTIIFSLSMLANPRSQFLLDRLWRCIKLFVSSESSSCHEFASQFVIGICMRENTSTHTRTHMRTHSRTRTHPPTIIAVQVVAARWVGAPIHDEVNAPFSPVPLAMNGRSVLHSNKQSRMRSGIRGSFWCFSRIKKA